jgi:hypothetical protein
LLAVGCCGAMALLKAGDAVLREAALISLAYLGE